LRSTLPYFVKKFHVFMKPRISLQCSKQPATFPCPEANNLIISTFLITIQCSTIKITFLLLPIWYTNFLFIYTDYIKLTFILLICRIGRARNSIPTYSHIQQDATPHSLFISGNCSTCFECYFHPSSGAHTAVSTASGICHNVTAI
jgi:hypothetical protein